MFVYHFNFSDLLINIGMLAARSGKIRVYEYEFQLHVTHCKLQVKFPCTFYLIWRAGDKTVEDGRAIGAVTDTIPFNTTLRANLDVAFDESTQLFLEKKTILFLNLNSNTAPETRNIGLINLDVAMSLNTNNMNDLRVYPLEKCADKSSTIMLSVKGKFLKELTARQISQSIGSPSPTRLADIGPKAKTTFDRAAIREKLGLTGGKSQQMDNQISHRSAESASDRIVTEFNIQKKAPAQNGDKVDNIITMENYEVKQKEQSAGVKLTKKDKTITIPMLSLLDSKKALTPTHNRVIKTDRAQHDLWIAKIHQNALQRKNQIMESSLRQEITRVKAMCQSLNTELSSQHILRVKLEAELQHCRVENLQLKQSQRNLQRELANGRTSTEPDSAVRLLRRNIERLQNQNNQKSVRISALEEEVLHYAHTKMDFAMKVQTLSHQLEQAKIVKTHEGVLQKKLSLCRADSFSLPRFGIEPITHHTSTQTQSSIPSLFQSISPFVQREAVKEKYQVNKQGNSQQQLEKALKVIQQLQLRLEYEQRKQNEINIKLEEIEAQLSITRHNNCLKQDSFIKKIQNLQAEVVQLKKSADPLSLELKTKRDHIVDMTLIIQYLQQKTDKQINQLESAQQELALYEIQLAHHKKQIDSLLHETIPKLKDQKDDISRDYSLKVIDLELNKRELQNQIKKYEGEIVLLKDKIDQLQYELVKERDRAPQVSPIGPSLQLEVRKFKNQLHDSPTESEKSQKQNRNLRRKLEQSQKIEEKYRIQIQQLTARNNLLQKYLKKFQTEVSNNRKVIEQLSSGKQWKQTSPQTSSRDLINQQKTNLQKQIKKLIMQKEKLEDKQDNLEDSVKRLLIERQRLEADNCQLKQEVTQSKEKLDIELKGSSVQNEDKQQQLIADLQNKLAETQSKYLEASRQASIHQSQTVALNQILKRYNLMDHKQQGSPRDLSMENRQLQHLLISVILRNKELTRNYKELSVPRLVGFREMSLELNKAKAKLISLGSNVENKKSIMLAIRPLQEKVQQLIKNNEQVRLAKSNGQVSSGDSVEDNNARVDF